MVSGDGDVCNEKGKCLNTMAQSLGTTVISGNNPTKCPVGQTTIMKAFNGTWYTYDNSSITSWNKIICGSQTTVDDSPLLYNDISHVAHTQNDCKNTVASGVAGQVVSDGSGHNMCKFTGATCPAGWTQYLSWSQTKPNSTPAYDCGTLNSGSHAWSNNNAIECGCSQVISTYNVHLLGWVTSCCQSPAIGYYTGSGCSACGSTCKCGTSSCDGPWRYTVYAERSYIGCY